MIRSESISVGGFRVYRVGFRAHEAFRSGHAPTARICIITRGLLLHDGQGRVPVANLLLTPPERPLSVRAGSAGASAIAVQCDTDIVRTRYAVSIDQPGNVHCVEALPIADRLTHELVRRDKYSPSSVEGMVLHLIAIGLRTGASAQRFPAPVWLQDVRDQIASDPTRCRTVLDVARHAGVHPSHLSRAFRAAFGMSISDYIRRARVRIAADLILNTRQSIAQVAIMTGFCDQSHFNRVFRRIAGTSPAKYRRWHGGGAARDSR